VNLNGRTTNPGELRTQIALQTRTVIERPGGYQNAAWTSQATVWSRWENAHGAEVWAAQSVQAEAPATVLIRYYAGVDPTWSVLKGADRYEIVSVDDIQERHEYMELKVRRMRDG
jgi:SPP1 family predicted phage head-tail adaptor